MPATPRRCSSSAGRTPSSGLSGRPAPICLARAPTWWPALPPHRRSVQGRGLRRQVAGPRLPKLLAGVRFHPSRHAQGPERASWCLRQCAGPWLGGLGVPHRLDSPELADACALGHAARRPLTCPIRSADRSSSRPGRCTRWRRHCASASNDALQVQLQHPGLLATQTCCLTKTPTPSQQHARRSWAWNASGSRAPRARPTLPTCRPDCPPMRCFWSQGSTCGYCASNVCPAANVRWAARPSTCGGAGGQRRRVGDAAGARRRGYFWMSPRHRYLIST